MHNVIDRVQRERRESTGGQASWRQRLMTVGHEPPEGCAVMDRGSAKHGPRDEVERPGFAEPCTARVQPRRGVPPGTPADDDAEINNEDPVT
jgi:hypothetical protein